MSARSIERASIEVMEVWPPYSPDLNMIELVWPLLNKRVAVRHPNTLDELTAAIKSAWVSITQGEIDAICSGFVQKVLEMHQNNGHC